MRTVEIRVEKKNGHFVANNHVAMDAIDEYKAQFPNCVFTFYDNHFNIVEKGKALSMFRAFTKNGYETVYSD